MPMISVQGNPLPPESPESLRPTGAVDSTLRHESVFALLLHDHVLQVLLALALIGNLALFAYLALRFEALPDALPLHFDATGLPDRIEAKAGIFGLPMIGLIVLFVNAVFGILAHRHQRAATLLLAAGALLVQILLWLAATNISGGLV